MQPWFTLSIGAAAVLLSILSADMQAVFQFDRAQIWEGDWWRLFTGHLVHWNRPHLVWDLVLFLICGGILEWICRPIMIGVTVLAAIVVSTGLLLVEPEMNFYRGLSALDMSLAASLCALAIGYCRFRKRTGLTVIWSAGLAICLLKPILEMVFGATFFVREFGTGVEASPVSHLLGTLVGPLTVWGISLWQRFWNRFVRNHISAIRRLWETSIS